MGKTFFPERESKLLEFKSIVPRFDALVKTCIAFANASGGRIIIGVDDESHEVIGIQDDDRRKIYDDFPNSLYDLSSPSLIAQIYEQRFDNQSVLIIEIPASPRKPYFLKSKGVSHGTYIRVGSSTRRATPEYIEDLTREAQRMHYDEEVIHMDIKQLSEDLLYDFFGKKVPLKRLVSERIIAPQAANKEAYAPTVAGVLMFTNNPEAFIPEAQVRCTLFMGTEGRDILQTEDITGTIEKQAEDSLMCIKRWTASRYALQGAKLQQILPVPVEALREAIINALLHRKYNIPGAVKIAIYEDRIEVFSPGCFPGLIDLNALGDGTTFLRNPHLVRLAYKQHLIETRGTGIKLIFDSCRKAHIKKPSYHEEGDFVKVVFYFEPDLTSYEEEDEAVLAFIALHKAVTAKQVARFLSVSHNTAIRKLGYLIKAKKINKQGRGPNVKYVSTP